MIDPILPNIRIFFEIETVQHPNWFPMPYRLMYNVQYTDKLSNTFIKVN